MSCRIIAAPYLQGGVGALAYAISPDDQLRSISRLPWNAELLEAEGWRFLFERGWWDATDTERLSQATGLFAICPTYGIGASQAWWRAFARSFLAHRDAVAAVAAIGEPTLECWCDGSNGTVPEETDSSGRNRGELAKGAYSMRDLRWQLEVPCKHLIGTLDIYLFTRSLTLIADEDPDMVGEFTLILSGGRLSVRDSSNWFDVPAKGSWPSPIATPARSFTDAVQLATGSAIRLSFEGGILSVDGAMLSGREI